MFIFFELTDYALLRFPKWISEQIAQKQSTSAFIFIYLEHYSGKNTDLQLLPENNEIHKLSGQVKNADAILKKYPQSLLITFALRPPDLYITAKAKQMGIGTFLVQHGVFIPFMKREKLFFAQKLKKIATYLHCSFTISSLAEISFFKILSDIYHIYMSGKKNIANSIFSSADIMPDFAFVYAEYWKMYFSNHYGFTNEQFFVMGCPDLENYKCIINQKKQNGICYICQTLVEDGRIDKNIFLNFIKIIADALRKEDIVFLKPHPRTNLSLYQKLTCRPNTFIADSNMPHCDKYIGHYSTLLSLCLHITGSVFLWEFDGHKIPDFFARSAKYVDNKPQSIKKFMIEKKINKPQAGHLAYFFGQIDAKPFEKVADILLENTLLVKHKS